MEFNISSGNDSEYKMLGDGKKRTRTRIPSECYRVVNAATGEVKLNPIKVEYCTDLYNDVNEILLDHGMSIIDLQFVVDMMKAEK